MYMHLFHAHWKWPKYTSIGRHTSKSFINNYFLILLVVRTYVRTFVRSFVCSTIRYILYFIRNFEFYFRISLRLYININMRTIWGRQNISRRQRSFDFVFKYLIFTKKNHDCVLFIHRTNSYNTIYIYI